MDEVPNKSRLQGSDGYEGYDYGAGPVQ
jgi:hypothetical protein